MRMKQAVRYELIGYKQSKCCLRGSNTHGDSNEANGAKRQRIESVARDYASRLSLQAVSTNCVNLNPWKNDNYRCVPFF